MKVKTRTAEVLKDNLVHFVECLLHFKVARDSYADALYIVMQVAAQNCRKRKIDQIKQLETEVTRIKCRKTELVTDHEKLMQQRATWSDLVQRLHDFVLKVQTSRINIFTLC